MLQEPDPAIILITLAVLIGSFCLLSGFVLLCAVSKAWQDETSEAILLMGECGKLICDLLSSTSLCSLAGIGLFITSLSCVTWKLTKAQRLAQLQEAATV